MNSGTDESQVRVILDTNILISAIGFGGVPREVFLLTIKEKIKGVISQILLVELIEVINKKFPRLIPDLSDIASSISELFLIVHPKESINIVRDRDDNRVLEAAVEGDCDFIITGDEDLLKLGKYKKIKIVTPAQFLELVQKLDFYPIL